MWLLIPLFVFLFLMFCVAVWFYACVVMYQTIEENHREAIKAKMEKEKKAKK